jgi:hypothetical protein
MFKRKPKQQVTVGEIVDSAMKVANVPMPASETQIMQRMLGEFMASTALSRLQSDVGSIAADFRQFRDNIHHLNTALGEFREQAIVPVKEELKYLRYNLGARSEDMVGSMQKLVHHLEAQIELLLKSRGVNPHLRDGAGETPLDRMGIAPDRPSYQDLAREGVALVDRGDATVDEALMQNARVEKLQGHLDRILAIARPAWGTGGETKALEDIINLCTGDAGL